MDKRNVHSFEELAKNLRRRLFNKFLDVKQGHPGSVFSIVDIIVALYHGGYIRKDADNSRALLDKLIISKGHATATIYPVLVDLGILPEAEFDNWGKGFSNLRVFGNTTIPGVDATTGSLGHGLGIAAGLALSNRQRGLDKRIFVIISEGELYEGSCWEALLFIKHHNLTNVKIILDRNNLMILGNTEDCVALNSISDKFKGFGFSVDECNGHDFPDVLRSFDGLVLNDDLNVVIANTIKGKGFSIMENKANWHYWNPLTAAEIEKCQNEVK